MEIYPKNVNQSKDYLQDESQVINIENSNYYSKNMDSEKDWDKRLNHLHPKWFKILNYLLYFSIIKI